MCYQASNDDFRSKFSLYDDADDLGMLNKRSQWYSSGLDADEGLMYPPPILIPNGEVSFCRNMSSPGPHVSKISSGQARTSNFWRYRVNATTAPRDEMQALGPDTNQQDRSG